MKMPLQTQLKGRREKTKGNGKRGAAFCAIMSCHATLPTQQKTCAKQEERAGRGKTQHTDQRTFLGGTIATAALGVMEMLCCFSLSPLIDRRSACTKPMAVSLVFLSLCPKLRRKGACFVFACLFIWSARAVMVILTEESLQAGGWHAKHDRYPGGIVTPVRQLGRGAVCSWQRMTCAVGNDAPSSLCNGIWTGGRGYGRYGDVDERI